MGLAFGSGIGLPSRSPIGLPDGAMSGPWGNGSLTFLSWGSGTPRLGLGLAGGEYSIAISVETRRETSSPNGLNEIAPTLAAMHCRSLGLRPAPDGE